MYLKLLFPATKLPSVALVGCAPKPEDAAVPAVPAGAVPRGAVPIGIVLVANVVALKLELVALETPVGLMMNVAVLLTPAIVTVAF